MGWRAGVEFAMMEKSVKAEWSGDRSFPPYGTGNNHNTWYACSMVDADGRELPWLDRDGRVLSTVSERYRPAPGQKFFIKGGGESDFPSYEFRGPDTPPVDELLKQGFKLPFYADLPAMPEHERRAIWGLMVGEEGKTKVPILQKYSGAGFDPNRDLLESYGDGWKSATFLPQERQLFGLPGGIMNDWHLRTNLEGLYAAGDQLFASNCHGHAAATGHYAGRHAAAYARQSVERKFDLQQVEYEKQRVFAPLRRSQGRPWKDLAFRISRTMQEFCGATKSEKLLKAGLEQIQEIQSNEAKKLSASDPHGLMRSLETLNVVTNAELVLQACLARRASSKQLHFHRTDFPEPDPPDWHKFITVRRGGNGTLTGEKPIDYYGRLRQEYEAVNKDYKGSRS
jgi:hypothetical protein